MKNLQKKLEALAQEFGVPSITVWQQGKFLDGSRYNGMSEEWKEQQRENEATLVRPGGGTNNALFQVAGREHPDIITEYLEALGRMLAEEINS